MSCSLRQVQKFAQLTLSELPVVLTHVIEITAYYLLLADKQSQNGWEKPQLQINGKSDVRNIDYGLDVKIIIPL